MRQARIKRDSARGRPCGAELGIDKRDDEHDEAAENP